MIVTAVVALGLELLAAFPGRLRWLIGLARLGVAAGAAPILLHNSIYLTDAAGPGTQEWSPAQAWMIPAGLALAMASVWAALLVLDRRTPGRSLPLAVSLACAGAAVTVMLSGYASGGQLGLPLAAGLAAVVIASLALAGPAEMRGVLGLGVVGLFALLIIGRFFGQVSTLNAALLFFAPLLGWLPELPFVRRMRPVLRGLARVGLTAAPVIVALALAQQKFVADSSRSSSTPSEPSLQDYMDFGK